MSYDNFRSFFTLFREERAAYLKASLPSSVLTLGTNICRISNSAGHIDFGFYTCMYTDKEEPAQGEIYI